MGKGDKKSKRGKINIGSFGVSRPRRKKKVALTGAAKPAVKAAEEVELQAEAKAAKKAVKKTEEVAVAAEKKPKAAKPKKKAEEGETEAAPEPSATE